VLVGVFTAIVAIPAGGPFEQLPDVLRQQVSGGSWHVLLLSTVSLVVFAAGVTMSASLGLRAAEGDARPVGSGTVAGAAIVLSLLLAAISHLAGEGFRPAVLAPVLVVGAVLVLCLWRWATTRSPAEAATDDPTVEPDRSGSAPSEAELRAAGEGDTRRVATLGGVVLAVGGVGLVRAATPFVLLGLTGARWRGWFVAGVLTAVLAVPVVRCVLLMGMFSDRLRGLRRRLAVFTGITVVTVTVVFAAILALDPSRAAETGATGAMAISFSLYALAVAGLQWLSRRWAAWSATERLGLGPRTPWAVLLALVYLTASLVTTAGGYHDARTLAIRGGAEGEETVRYRHESVDAALDDWLAAQTVCDRAVPADPSQLPDGTGPAKRPLVLVAAPGGGIRAAVWTTFSLDRLFPDDCARARIFAVSGASGGSVGAVTWQVALDHERTRDAEASTDHDDIDTSPRSAIERMSGQDALAAGIAGLLLRDLPQPVIGLTDQWRDRAALIEDGWIEQSGVFGQVGDPARWTDLGADADWVPIQVLNASSVTDGCRVTITNIVGLPTSRDSDCSSTVSVGDGPARAAIDPLGSLRHQRGRCGSGELSTVTAALLSARFPFVTPSGALHSCTVGSVPGLEPDGRERTTYTVDGGYYENSGILALLEILDEIEESDRRERVEPWIVVLDNHYRSAATSAPEGRPNELLVPVQTLLGNRGLDQVTLEQAGSEAVYDGARGCSRLVRVGPSVSPGLSAPLGWTLSEASLDHLADALEDSVTSLLRRPVDNDEGVEASTCSLQLLNTLGVAALDDPSSG
jgi:hypothetical protein